MQEAAATYDKLLRRADSRPWRAQGRQGLETTLQGLSAGTFLGLKITEPKVTDVPEKPKEAEGPPPP